MSFFPPFPQLVLYQETYMASEWKDVTTLTELFTDLAKSVGLTTPEASAPDPSLETPVASQCPAPETIDLTPIEADEESLPLHSMQQPPDVDLLPGESLRLINGRWFIESTKHVLVAELKVKHRCSIQNDVEAQSNDDTDKQRDAYIRRLNMHRFQELSRQRLVPERQTRTPETDQQPAPLSDEDARV